MNNTKNIIYWHQLGFKIYKIDKKLIPKLEKEVESNDLIKISAELNYLSGQTISIVLADSISYLYEKTIDPPLIVDNNFKSKLLEIIKQDIPEDFSQFNWDFKLKDDPNKKQKVIIFAPIKEFQKIISQISNKLNIKINVIEPESIALTRDPNPIIGIYKKIDIKGKDEEVLNLLLNTQTENTKKPIKNIFLIMVVIIFLITAVFLVIKLKKPTSKNSTILIPTPTPILISTPTSISTSATKEWSDLKILVQNGTKIAGLAAKTATIFKTDGVNQVDTGNADSTNYNSNKLIFKDISLKEAYQDKFKEFLTITDDNISIDNEITYDVIVITISN